MDQKRRSSPVPIPLECSISAQWHPFAQAALERTAEDKSDRTFHRASPERACRTRYGNVPPIACLLAVGRLALAILILGSALSASFVFALTALICALLFLNSWITKQQDSYHARLRENFRAPYRR